MSASWSVHHEAALGFTVEHPPLRAAPPTSPGNDSDRQKARDGSNGTFLRWDCQLAISAVTESTSVRAGAMFQKALLSWSCGPTKRPKERGQAAITLRTMIAIAKSCAPNWRK